VRPPGLLSLGFKRTGKGRLRRWFCLDCEPDHISVASADLFISHRTFPWSGRAPRQSRPADVLRSGGFVFWIATARPGAPCAAPSLETLASADAFLDFDPGFPHRSWIHRSLAPLLRKAQL
jgi:hypothetical protein